MGRKHESSGATRVLPGCMALRQSAFFDFGAYGDTDSTDNPSPRPWQRSGVGRGMVLELQL
jgi:hypothetical protein